MKFANGIALGVLLVLSAMVTAVAARTAQQTITGRVVAVTAASLTIRTPYHGPGLSHGPGIHSMLLIAGKTLQIDISHAAWRKTDGTPIARPHLVIGDQVTIDATPWQNGTYRATTVRLTVPTK